MKKNEVIPNTLTKNSKLGSHWNKCHLYLEFLTHNLEAQANAVGAEGSPWDPTSKFPHAMCVLCVRCVCAIFVNCLCVLRVCCVCDVIDVCVCQVRMPCASYVCYLCILCVCAMCELFVCAMCVLGACFV